MSRFGFALLDMTTLSRGTRLRGEIWRRSRQISPLSLPCFYGTPVIPSEARNPLAYVCILYTVILSPSTEFILSVVEGLRINSAHCVCVVEESLCYSGV